MGGGERGGQSIIYKQKSYIRGYLPKQTLSIPFLVEEEFRMSRKLRSEVPSPHHGAGGFRGERREAED